MPGTLYRSSSQCSFHEGPTGENAIPLLQDQRNSLKQSNEQNREYGPCGKKMFSLIIALVRSNVS